MKHVVFFDCEYRNNKSLKDLVCIAATVNGFVDSWDLTTLHGVESFKNFYAKNLDNTWACYSAEADLSVLLTLGLPLPEKFIDLMAEARMMTLTHPDHFAVSASMLDTLKAFRIIDSSQYIFQKSDKLAMRDLILGNEVYDDNQMQQIIQYCRSDISDLERILVNCEHTHYFEDTGVEREHMLNRGEFLKAEVTMKYSSRGIPIDYDNMEWVYKHAKDVRANVAMNLNDKIGHEVYQFEGPKAEPKRKLVFKSKNFGNYIYRLGLLDKWKCTESGRLSLTDEHLKEMGSRGHIEELRQVRKLMKEVSDKPEHDRRRLVNWYNDSPGLSEGGGWKPFVPCPSIPFAQKSSRTSPLPSKGFLFASAPWMRNLFIRPAPGDILVGLDWKSQEIAIAASKSEDENMRTLYNAADIYLHLAQEAKELAHGWQTDVEAAKQEHKAMRQQFKAIQLGLGYGKGVNSLGADLFNMGGLTEDAAHCRAQELFDWHHEHFYKFWEWVDSVFSTAKEQGFLTLSDHWVYWLDDDTRPQQIQNIPVQTGGAYMMREAVKLFDRYGLNEFVTFQHDAVYFMAREDNLDQQIALATDCMNTASDIVIGDFCPCTLGKPDIYTNDKPYHDSRGDMITDQLKELIV